MFFLGKDVRPHSTSLNTVTLKSSGDVKCEYFFLRLITSNSFCIYGECTEIFFTSSVNTRKVFNHTRKIRTQGVHIWREIVYDDNEPLADDPCLVVPLERYHDGHPKPECRAYKLLGIHLDEHFNFNYHTNFLCNKLSRSLFCIRRAKNILTPSALKTLYFAFIQSHLNYCPIILSSISQQNFNQIKLIQKKAIRSITNSAYTAHTAPLFVQLQILPYELIVKQSKLLFMHSIEYSYAPSSFSDIWTKNYINQGDRPLRNAVFLPTTLCYRTPILNFSKNHHFITCRWNGTILMMPNIFEIGPHSKLPLNLACLIPS